MSSGIQMSAVILDATMRFFLRTVYTLIQAQENTKKKKAFRKIDLNMANKHELVILIFNLQ